MRKGRKDFPFWHTKKSNDVAGNEKNFIQKILCSAVSFEMLAGRRIISGQVQSARVIVVTFALAMITFHRKVSTYIFCVCDAVRGFLQRFKI